MFLLLDAEIAAVQPLETMCLYARSSALVLIELLINADVTISVYDHAVMEQTRKRFGISIEYAADKYAAVEGADALLLVTEWKEFRLPDFERMKRLMRTPLLLDGRNIFDREELLNCGVKYEKIG